MVGDRYVTKVATLVAALCLLSEACSGSPMPTPGANASATAPPPSRLVVLGDGPAGERGLWTFEAPNTWSEAASLPGATGIARFGDSVAISSGGSVELRSAATPAAPGSALPLRWQGPSPAAQIVSLARAPGGKVAIATSDGESQSYWLVAADGVLGAAETGPGTGVHPARGLAGQFATAGPDDRRSTGLAARGHRRVGSDHRAGDDSGRSARLRPVARPALSGGSHGHAAFTPVRSRRSWRPVNLALSPRSTPRRSFGDSPSTTPGPGSPCSRGRWRQEASSRRRGQSDTADRPNPG